MRLFPCFYNPRVSLISHGFGEGTGFLSLTENTPDMCFSPRAVNKSARDFNSHGGRVNTEQP